MKADRYRQGLEQAIQAELMKYADYSQNPKGIETLKTVIYTILENYRIVPKGKKNAGID